MTALVNYRLRGERRVMAGVLADGRVHALGPLIGANYATMQDVYEDWDGALAKLMRLGPDLGPGVVAAEVELRPPSLRPSALYFAGFNYHDHVENMYRIQGIAPPEDPKALGLPPWHNLKPTNTLCGDGDTVELLTEKVDWEVELAVVIGRTARRVSVQDALDCVAGYTIAIDLSARDRAFRPQTPVDSPARMDWVAQKGFDGACPLGPCLVLSQDVPDPQQLGLSLSVNGQVMQDSNTSAMIFSVADAIAHLSSMVTLSPGDIILTGTPAGTGAERGQFLKPGDTIRAVIVGLGELTIHTR